MAKAVVTESTETNETQTGNEQVATSVEEVPKVNADPAPLVTGTSTEEQSFWDKHGFGDMVKDKTDEQIAELFHSRNKKYGDQANELGTVRSQLKESAVKLAEYEKLAGKVKEETPSNPLESIADMTEGELRDFEMALEKNPRGAIANLVAPIFQTMIEQMIGNTVKKDVLPMFDNVNEAAANQIEEANFRKENPDWQQYSAMAQELVAPGRLETLWQNGQLSYGDVYDLAKLANETDSDPTKNPLYQMVYKYMKKGLGFEEAKELVEYKLSQSARAEADNLKLADEKEKLKTVIAGDGKSGAKTENEAKTLDEVWSNPG